MSALEKALEAVLESFVRRVVREGSPGSSPHPLAAW